MPFEAMIVFKYLFATVTDCHEKYQEENKSHDNVESTRLERRKLDVPRVWQTPTVTAYSTSNLGSWSCSTFFESCLCYNLLSCSIMPTASDGSNHGSSSEEELSRKSHLSLSLTLSRRKKKKYFCCYFREQQLIFCLEVMPWILIENSLDSTHGVRIPS